MAGDEIARIDAAIEHFKALALRTDDRWAMYTAKTLPERARTLASLVLNGGYTGKGRSPLG
jgi:hypothetical protein